MTTPIIIALVVMMLCVDACIIWAVVSTAVEGFFKPLSKRFAVREVGPGAFEKEFQSFSMGAMNFGGSIHVAVDDEFVHVAPVKVLRWMGAQPFSLPLQEVTLAKGVLPESVLAPQAGLKKLRKAVPARFGGIEVMMHRVVMQQVLLAQQRARALASASLDATPAQQA